MSVEMDVQLDRQTITRFSQDCGEPDWMRALRLESLERAEALPLPKLEKISLKNWNFTRFTPFRAEAPLSSPETLPQALRDLFAAGETRNLLVQQNSSVVFRQVAEDLARQASSLPTSPPRCANTAMWFAAILGKPSNRTKTS